MLSINYYYNPLININDKNKIINDNREIGVIFYENKYKIKVNIDNYSNPLYINKIYKIEFEYVPIIELLGNNSIKFKTLIKINNCKIKIITNNPYTSKEYFPLEVYLLSERIKNDLNFEVFKFILKNEISLEYNLNLNIFENKFIYNPSIMFQLEDGTYNNKIVLDEECKFLLSYRSQITLRDKSKIYIKTNNLIKYDKINNNIIIEFNDKNQQYGDNNEALEDSRFIILYDQLYLLYSHYNSFVKQILSPYSDYNNKIEILKSINLNYMEKNWVIFWKLKSIYIIYKFYPEYIVYELEESNEVKKIKSIKYPFKEDIRGGTSPILVDNKYYLFSHSRINGYRLSLIVIDYETLDILSYSSNLLNENIAIKKITYCRGSIYIENLKTFIISVGINDSKIEFINLSLDYVNSKLS